MPPSFRFPPLREGNRVGSVPPACRGNLTEGVVRVHTEPMREPYIEIYSLHAPERTLVTVIEILSPANKTPNSEGRRQYLRKQRDLLNSAVHLLEIDLLHEGAHTVFPRWRCCSVSVQRGITLFVYTGQAGRGARRMCGSPTSRILCPRCLYPCVHLTPMLWYTCRRRTKIGRAHV